MERSSAAYSVTLTKLIEKLHLVNHLPEINTDEILITDPDINRPAVQLAGFLFQVLHTPGHTVGGCCYYCAEEQVLFSGDTLFHGSVGRTDFPTGSMGMLHDSIHRKLFVLPAETTVYPGHGEATDIAYEKRYNPY